MDHTDQGHAGPAWLLSGIMNTPGVLRLQDGRLAFLSDDGVVFDEPLAAVEKISFPWYQMACGFTAVVAGTKRRIALARPNGAPAPGRALVEMVGPEVLGAAGSIGDLVAGRRRGLVWRALLQDRTGARAA
jgi:hypothetical protein